MSGFQIIKPHKLTDASLVSSTVVEVAPASYVAGTTYAALAIASVPAALGVRHVYESLQAANTGHAPATSPTWWRWLCDVYQAYAPGATYARGERVQDNVAHLIYESVNDGNTGKPLSDATQWLVVQATNRWAFQDEAKGTVSTMASPMRLVLKPGPTSGIGFQELQGSKLKVQGHIDGRAEPVYSREVDLDGAVITSIFDWFFEEFEQLSEVALTDLPYQFYDLRLTIEITSTAGSVGVGVARPGKLFRIGNTRAGAKAGILSFSSKERKFGALRLVKGENSKRNDFSVVTDARDFRRIYQLLASLDGELCFYMGTDVRGFEPLFSYSYYLDFSIAVDYHSHHLLAIQTEGL